MQVIQIGKHVVLVDNLDLSKWPKVLESALNDNEKDVFYRRKRAIEEYIQKNRTLAEIKQATGIYQNEIYRLLYRCLTLDNDGEIYGYKALIPGFRIKNYTRKIPAENSSNLVGAFTKLLDQYPQLEEFLFNIHFYPQKVSLPKRKRKKYEIWRAFKNECKKLGIKDYEYPFCTFDQARRSVERHLAQLEKEFFTKGAAIQGGKDAARHARRTGFGPANILKHLLRAYEVVQLDGHKIDGIFVIGIETPDGLIVYKQFSRIYILVLIDVATRAILGYHLSLSGDFNELDVLKCIINALAPWKPIKFTIPVLYYHKDAGFPSGIYERAAWACWDTLQYDNARANLSNLVKAKLQRTIGCSINVGPVATPEYRPHIESFFKSLEEMLYHRLPNTTGSSEDDPRRNDPEKKACEYKMTYRHLQEFTEYAMADYNRKPLAALHSLSPLKAMEQRLQQMIPVRVLHPSKRKEMQAVCMEKQVTIRGNIKEGKRPYIQFLNAIYSSDILSQASEMIGTLINIVIDVDDLRSVEAYLPDGSHLGYLHARGIWGITPHSLETRKEINRLIDDEMFEYNSGEDIINSYELYLVEKARKNKGARKKLQRVREEKSSNLLIFQDQQPDSQIEKTENSMIKKTLKKSLKTAKDTVLF